MMSFVIFDRYELFEFEEYLKSLNLHRYEGFFDTSDRLGYFQTLRDAESTILRIHDGLNGIKTPQGAINRGFTNEDFVQYLTGAYHYAHPWDSSKAGFTFTRLMICGSKPKVNLEERLDKLKVNVQYVTRGSDRVYPKI